MLRRQNWPQKDYSRRIHFGPRWLRVKSGFDDGGEEQKTAEREGELVELDVVGKGGVLEGEAAHPARVTRWVRATTTFMSPKEEDVHNCSC
jgi:hypothetical protein